MIPCKNIYYMLAYAFQVLTEHGYKSISAESFNNTAELLAAILCKGVSVQIKRGLVREYIPKSEPLSSPRGQIEISETLRTMAMQRKQLVCSYDEFSPDAYNNRIIKTTFILLLRTDISKQRKREIKKLLVYFSAVNVLDKNRINWKGQYNKNNQTYRMLIAVCYLIIKGLLQTQCDGTMKLMDFLDEQRMSRLYEKFILEYYRKNYPELDVSSSLIPWALDDGYSDMLPVMHSDIMIRDKAGKNILIIDAKYYSHTTQLQYDTRKLHSGNLYQIFTYVKNAQYENTDHRVSGMLLYARTDEDIQPDNVYHMSGNQISVRTLDLNMDFSEIEHQLKSFIVFPPL